MTFPAPVKDAAARILYVEDDRALRSLVCDGLRKSGLLVEAVGSSLEGFQAFQRERPSLVLLDVSLPDESGFSFCRRLRREFSDEVPVIFLTVHGEARCRVDGFEAGGQDFIAKPVELRELEARVRVHLRLREERRCAEDRMRELEEKELSRQELVDMIVHDLKVPLTAITGSASILRRLKERSDPDFVSKYLDISGDAAEMMLLMIDDILDAGRGEAGRLEPHWEEVDAADILGSLRKLFSSRSRRRSVSLPELARGSVRFRADRRLLLRILCNLISNGLRYGGGDVELRLERGETGSPRFLVLDRGPGIPESERERIFEKHVRLRPERDAETARPRGCGIGLRFCRLAAQALKARVRVEGREGGGSRFVLGF